MSKWQKTLNFKKILIIFLSIKALDLLTVVAAHHTIPYLGFFPMRRDILSFNLPYFLTNFANFDGVHYLNIARWGYSMYEQAFFPLYPLFISLLSNLYSNHLVIGLLMSNISYLFGIYLLYLFLKNYLSGDKIFWILILLAAFPTSFFFGAVYTEGLFLFFSAGYLLFVKRKNILISLLFGICAALTRNIGIFLVIPAIFILLENKKSIKTRGMFLLGPLFGLGLYSLYLFKTVGDPLFFYHSLPAFGVNKSDSIILLPQVVFRYLKIFITFDFNFQYFIAVLELTVFASVVLTILYFLRKRWDYVKKNKVFLGLTIFSLIQIVLPSMTGTLSSIPRYSLFALSFFIFLSFIERNYIKNFIFVIFLIFHIILLGFFVQGYFVS